MTKEKFINICDPDINEKVLEERCRQIIEENTKKELKEACHNMLCVNFSKGQKCYKECAYSNCNLNMDYIDDVKKCFGYKLWNKLDTETKKTIFLNIK